jgi:hypothetical protein
LHSKASAYPLIVQSPFDRSKIMKFPPFQTTIVKLIVAGLMAIGGLSVSGITFADSLQPFTIVAETFFRSNFQATQAEPPAPFVTGDAVVSTDKPDYAPGETVYITGYGFTPGETVQVQVVHPPGSLKSSEMLVDHAGHDPWLVTASISGRINTSWLVDEDSLGRTLLLTADGLSSLAHAELTFTDNFTTDFQQCANNDAFGTPHATILGRCHWINSIVQGSNSITFEGMSILQRFVVKDIPAPAGNHHSLTFSHQATKGGTHAYDWLTSFEQAIAVAHDYNVDYTDLAAAPLSSPGAGETKLTTFTTARACGVEISAPLAPVCVALRNGAFRANVLVPDDPFVSKDGPTQPRITSYEGQYGNRYIRLYSNAAITNPTLTLLAHDPAPDGSDTSDSEIKYSLNWDSTGDQVLVEFAGHLAVTGDGTGMTWGLGLGSSQINGGPYHFHLDKLDNTELGNQDNQVKGADILIIPPQGAISVTKNVVGPLNDPQDFTYTATGGLPTPFILDDDGSDPTQPKTRTFTDLAAGVYVITEGSVSGWDATNLTCIPGSAGAHFVADANHRIVTITLDSNTDTIACFYENTKRGHVIIVKDAQPNDAQDFSFTNNFGNGNPTPFALDDDADGTLSNTRDSEVLPGTFAVSEGAVSGWDLTSSVCSDGSDPSAIGVSAGETVTCTFTNVKRGHILVDKVTNPAGDPQSFGFTSNYGGPFNLTDAAAPNDSGTLVPGTYNVAENAQAGWDLTSATCSDGSPVTAISLQAGETITCTFTNTKRGHILVDKVTNPAGDPQLFGFTSNYGAPFNLADASPVNDSGPLAFGTYNVAEGAQAGWDLTSATCSDGSPVTAISLQAGETVTCTFTNTKQGQITITKDAVPNSLTDFPYTSSSNTSTAIGSFSLDDDAGVPGGDATLPNTRTFTGLKPGNYSVTEGAVAGWTLTNLSCTAGGTPTGAVANIVLPAGGSVSCTYTNAAPDMSIAITPNTATNEVRNAHVFTVTVTQVPNGATPATTVDITRTVTPTPNITNTTTCGAGIAFVGNVATCTITINSGVPNVFTANASATAVIGGLTLTRATNGNAGPGGSGPATKTFVDARINLSPLNATNDVGQNHVITAFVEESTGGAFGPSVGRTVTFSLVNNGISAAFVGSNTCVTDATGHCPITIVAPNPGGVDIHATTSFTLSGIPLTRSTADGLTGDGPNAHKNYVSGFVTINPSAVNEVNHAHTFTVVVTQQPGALTPATSANITITPTPAPGSITNNCVNPVAFAGLTATCTYIVNNPSAGLFSVSVTASFVINGTTVTRSTDGTGNNSGPATKRFVDARITLTPGTATNPINSPHTITATVEQNDGLPAGAPGGDAVTGFGPAPNGTVVSFSLLNNTAGATFVNPPPNQCTVAGGAGMCTIQINSSQPGGVDIHGTTTFLVGGVSLTRASDGTHGSSGDAHKDYVAARLHIVKMVVPSSDTTQFTFTPTGGWNGNATFQLANAGNKDSGFLAPGTYGANETTDPAFDLTGRSCVNTVGGGAHTFSTPGTGVSVVLAAGDDVTCTFTNTRKATIIVKKVMVGGTGTFTYTGTPSGSISVNNGTIQSTVSPGQYVSTEAAQAGWDLTSVSCDDANSVGSVPNSNATFNAEAGETVTCTFTNTKRGHILIDKVTVPSGDPQSFGFTSNYGAPFNLTDVSAPNDSGALVTGTYNVAEGAQAGWVLTNTSCTDGSPVTAISLQPGETITCTFTNSKLPTLIVKKMISGNSATFHFGIDGTPTDPPNANIDLTPPTNGMAQSDLQVIQLGDYTATEINIPSGWLLTDASCVSDQGGFVTDNTGLPAVTFTANYGDDIVCTYIDDQQGGATRTQGFWATHTVLTNAIWNGTALPPGTGDITPVPVIGSADAKLCTLNDITAIAFPLGQNQVMGGFWAGISKMSTGPKRSNLDQARMQLLQQYLAAVLNVHAFGTPIPGTTLADARTAYCGTNPAAINAQHALLAAYNTSGDNVLFTPGVNATAKASKAQANIPFWDITFR